MQSHFYGLCGLITIFGIHSTSAYSLLHDEPIRVLAPNEFDEKTNNSGRPMSVLPDQDDETEEIKCDLKDPLCAPVRPKELKFTKGKERRKAVVLKAIRRILEDKSKNKTRNKMKQYKVTHDVDFVAATDVLRIALIKTRTKRAAKREKLTTTDKIHNSASELAQTNVKTRSKRYAKLDEISNGRDIVLEAVRQLIESEKTRRRYDMVNPPNSQYSKRQQLLWDRLRVKAAEELLLHPKRFPERATERIYDSLKLDMELATPGPTMEPGLFNDFKTRIEKQYYQAEYDRWIGRDFISTLKPVVYE